MPVPDLKECCQLCIIHHIIGDDIQNKLYQQQQKFLLSQLDEGAWGAESLDILKRAVRHHGYFISSEVILALLPNTTKELSLKECPGLNEECLNTILERCDCLQTLDITENPLLKLSSIHIFSHNNEYMYTSLTSVILEDCSQARDSHIQNLIRKAPLLQHLNIARCCITDLVFLLDEQKQLAREACLEIKGLTSIFDSHLETVDVSRCLEFSSTGVRHLCTLCGPTLHSVNLAWTKVDCTALLYLSGLGLPSAVEFFMASGAVSTEMTELLLENMHQFDVACQCIAAKWRDGKDQLTDIKSDEDVQRNVTTDCSRKEDGCICIDEINPYFISSALTQPHENADAPSSMSYHSDIVQNKSMDPYTDILSNSNTEEDFVTNRVLSNSAQGFQVICMDDLLQSSHSVDKNKIFKKPYSDSHNPSCEISRRHTDHDNSRYLSSSQENETSNESEGHIVLSDKDTQENSLKISECKSETLACFNQVKDNSKTDLDDSNILSLKSIEDENIVVDDSQTEYDCACSAISSDCKKNNDRHQTSGVSDNEPYFKSRIDSISLTALIFREEILGLRCFQKFLTTNQNVKSVTIYSGIVGNFLSDNVLDLVCTYCRGLESLCVEGSDKLTSVGILEIANKCKHLTSIDLTGVSFVGDEGIIPLVKSLPLTHLKLAETRVTEMFMNQMANLPLAQELKELDLSWCEEIASVESINSVISSCPQLEKLMLRECCIANTTLTCMAQHSQCITELSLASNMSVMRDEDVILLCGNLPLLISIDLGWNSFLTNPSIDALLSNCQHLERANLEGLKLITSAPFMPLVSVPEVLSVHLRKKAESNGGNDPETTSKKKFQLEEYPCLPHRSSTYSTHLTYVNLTYSDFVEDAHLQQIVTITHGGVEMLDYYGNKVEPSKASLKSFLQDYMEAQGRLE